MRRFVAESLPSRVIFEPGGVQRASEELDRVGVKRAWVLSTPEQAQMAHELSARLGEQAIGVFTDATMHTPVEVTERAMEALRLSEADGLVAIGGGSTIGLAKALAMRTDLPQLAIPTTYAGSEMTTILGQTEGGLKTTLRDRRVLPETVIYDVELTLGLPVKVSVASGLNAMAHAVEALYTDGTNPVLQLMAEEGLRALFSSLPQLKNAPRALTLRSEAQYGAWLCAVCLGHAGVALHHKLCHVLGGAFDLPHAETHAVVLPYALAYNAPAIPDAITRVKRALACERPAAALQDLARAAGLPTSLRELGMAESGIPRAVELATRDTYPNPRPVVQPALTKLLEDAWNGRPARYETYL